VSPTKCFYCGGFGATVRIFNVASAAQARRAGHVLPPYAHPSTNPKNRLYGETFNADWFDFWLNNHEDSNPGKGGKAEQYKSWREIRRMQEENKPKYRRYRNVPRKLKRNLMTEKCRLGEYALLDHRVFLKTSVTPAISLALPRALSARVPSPPTYRAWREEWSTRRSETMNSPEFRLISMKTR
jgi:hypothetical protein